MLRRSCFTPRPLLALAAATVALLAACQQQTAEESPTPGASPVASATSASSPTPAPDAPALGASAGFALGVEYMELGLAETYAATGVHWAKTRLEAFAWGINEPDPPVGGVHTYDWSLTDALIAEYQHAGIVHIHSYLNPASDWGSVSATAAKPDVMPKDEYLEDFGDWVAALIERYDADGVDDMPGLLAPVDRWTIGGEWTGFWGSGDVDDYLRLLEVASERARAASDTIVVGTIPFMLVDVFHGNEPTPEEIATRLVDPPRCCRNSTAGILAILDRPELFDEVSVHSLGDYTELRPLIRWLRARMAERGYDRPVIIDDAFPTSGLASFELIPGTGWPVVYPVTPADRAEVLDILISAARGDRPDSEEALAWVRRETAIGLVRKVVTAYAEGYAGIQVGNLEDWVVDQGPILREAQVNLIGAATMMGMIDVAHRDGYRVDSTRNAGDPRPAYLNLSLLIDKLGSFGFDSVEPIGDLRGPRGYRLERDGTPIWVLWNEAGLLLPGQPLPTTEVTLDIPDGYASYTVTEAVARSGQDAPSATIVSDGLDGTASTLTIELTPIPVFLELSR